MEIRNVAIIAHVDHGKTTLVDQLLRTAGAFRSNEEVETRIMDSNDIERERGITILAKTTSINFNNTHINILDTPGHADFGGEVERIMNMVDGCLLLVDAFEGTMPQTRFVLKKALAAHVKPIVIINKIDRSHADIKGAVDQVLNLFIDLGAPDEFLDFPIVYTSALKGTSARSANPDDQKPGMDAVLKAIIDNIPAPKAEFDAPFQMQVSLLDYNDFVGRIGIGTIRKGSVHVDDIVTVARLNGTTKQFRVMKLFGYESVHRLEIESASAGQIVAIAGLPDINVGETVCSSSHIEPLPPIKLDEPTIQMTFGTNSSPFSGQEGKQVTARKIEERLFKETQKDVALRVKRIPKSESWIVSGRGELHLSILIENMRRESFELEVSKPRVIIKEVDGVKYEPYEDLTIDVPNEYVGDVMTSIGTRGGELLSMEQRESVTLLTYVISSRGLIGYSTMFMSLTKGYGILSHTYREYRPMTNIDLGQRPIGVLVATEAGQATPYAIQHIEERGTMFLEPGIIVYEGMIVGENRYPIDLAVNVTTKKALTNMRSSNKDNTVVLKTPRKMSLESCLDYINSDELVEITPSTYRMRKKILNTVERKKYDSRMRNTEE
ncbi:MAG: translational GTPase TypA [Erysipelotrichaceae bacterium]|jgi:GTP-binding protein|nr:translational GTPase TypA [Bacilli bacterium]NLV29246.1 translational GTPase TypA [Erysipelotrichaceae bacterium]HPY79712.1 translational GTPase TypA [Bacilli bacterium]HQA55648.1 translational GTPase TypA [Bacilli bacterium]